MFLLVLLQALLVTSAAPEGRHLQPRATTTIPDYVNKYAPLVYLDQNEVYLPSDIQATLNNTFVALNFTSINDAPTPLLLSDLDQVNPLGDCSVDSFDDCPLFLTSKTNVSTDPSWLHGVLPEATTYETVGARSCAVIVNDHGNGIVDAFYMYYYAFNLGDIIEGQRLGNHVGDWEHTMLRFENGVPIAVWYSQHDNGQTFTYDAVSKKGLRPLVYSSIGGHANYAVPGTHSRNINGLVVINDTTSAGPLWDPVLSAYYYTYEPDSSLNGTFTGSESSTPISWLYFLGRWGDEQYPDSDPRQNNFLNLSLIWRYETGPTGPLDKSLNRTNVCPNNKNCTTLTALPASSGVSIPVTVTRASATTTSGSTSSGTSAGLSASTSTGAAYHLGLKGSFGVGMGVAGALAIVL